MTTPAQAAGGKGKKKKENHKLSLDEFNQVDAPVGHSVVNVKVTGIDWAATMANYEQSSDTQQIIVPAAPRSHRAPDIDFDSLPNEPPFKVSVFNLPLSVEERDISERFFQNLEIKSIETTKSCTNVEFANKDALYEALSKDGVSFKNKTVNVCLYGQQPPQNNYGSGGYGNRGGYGERYDRFSNDRYENRYDRNQGNTYVPPRGDRGDRPSYGRDSYGAGGGYNRQGQGSYGARGGYNDRHNDRYSDRGNMRDDRSNYSASGGSAPAEEDQKNWRDRPAPAPAQATHPHQSYNHGPRQPYHRQPAYQSYQPPSHHSESHYQPSRYNNQPANNNYPPHQNNQSDRGQAAPPPPVLDERPKLQLTKRKVPLKLDEPATRNPAIFGEAKPSNKPYEKMAEVEEKLKAIQLKDKPKEGPPSVTGSQTGSQTGSTPRSRKVSSNHDDAS